MKLIKVPTKQMKRRTMMEPHTEWLASSWTVPALWSHVIGAMARATNELVSATRMRTMFFPAGIDQGRPRRRLFDYGTKGLIEDCERDVATDEFPVELTCEMGGEHFPPSPRNTCKPDSDNAQSTSKSSLTLFFAADPTLK